MNRPDRSRRSATVGIVSDTHVGEALPRLPPSVSEALAGSDMILHAGDLTDLAVLDELGRIAPVVAVQGNHDREGGIELPRTAVVEAGGAAIGIVHGDRSAPREWAAGAAAYARGRSQTPGLLRHLLAQVGDVDVVVFGHFHEAYLARVDGTLVVNPGAVYQPEIDPGFEWTAPAARLLARYRRRLPVERIRPSVGRLRIEDGRAEAELVPLPEPVLPTMGVSTRCHHPER